MKTRILKILQTADHGKTHGDIAADLGEPQEVILQCLFLLHGHGIVGRTSQDRWHLIARQDHDYVEVK